MATTAEKTRRSRSRDSRTDATDDRFVSRASGEVPTPLGLLDDEYAREILTVLSVDPKQGRELVEVCEASRPTVYRRVNRLEDAGLVAAEMTVDPDGHHCKEFRLVRDRLTVTVEDGAITVTARPSGTDPA
jgi:predicted transcriptional regulator